MLLYTDGILERPGSALGGASVELAHVAADVAAGRALSSTDPTTVQRVATQTLELLTRVTGHTDDITLLAAQRVSPVGPFAVRLDATAEVVADLRAALAVWFDGVHAGAEDTWAVQHAVGELVSNAVEHAYRDTPHPGPVSVTATLTGAGEVRVEVRDEGRWREPAPLTERATGRGRGLWMVDRLVDELVVEHPGGTTVAFVRRKLTCPARLLTTDTLNVRPTPVPTAPRSLVVEVQAADRLAATGPVDSVTAPVLAAALRRATAVGSRVVTVDLTGVTHLASAGVAVLHDADLRSLANGTPLRLYAPAGSPADQILTLVALPHTTEDGDTENRDQ